ncbi:hypothetical protein C8F01DRAFT_544715 [Mycena amicta]|nr:hypothetical protein C8F01DRAFT_544715 [Mycena amicta]
MSRRIKGVIFQRNSITMSAPHAVAAYFVAERNLESAKDAVKATKHGDREQRIIAESIADAATAIYEAALASATTAAHGVVSRIIQTPNCTQIHIAENLNTIFLNSLGFALLEASFGMVAQILDDAAADPDLFVVLRHHWRYLHSLPTAPHGNSQGRVIEALSMPTMGAVAVFIEDQLHVCDSDLHLIVQSWRTHHRRHPEQRRADRPALATTQAVVSNALEHRNCPQLTGNPAVLEALATALQETSFRYVAEVLNDACADVDLFIAFRWHWRWLHKKPSALHKRPDNHISVALGMHTMGAAAALLVDDLHVRDAHLRLVIDMWRLRDPARYGLQPDGTADIWALMEQMSLLN